MFFSLPVSHIPTNTPHPKLLNVGHQAKDGPSGDFMIPGELLIGDFSDAGAPHQVDASLSQPQSLCLSQSLSVSVSVSADRRLQRRTPHQQVDISLIVMHRSQPLINGAPHRQVDVSDGFSGTIAIGQAELADHFGLSGALGGTKRYGAVSSAANSQVHCLSQTVPVCCLPMLAAGCLPFAACCLLFAVCCLLLAAACCCCLLLAACCLLSLLLAACCDLPLAA